MNRQDKQVERSRCSGAMGSVQYLILSEEEGEEKKEEREERERREEKEKR
jgi:hypothetical protein